MTSFVLVRGAELNLQPQKGTQTLLERSRPKLAQYANVRACHYLHGLIILLPYSKAKVKEAVFVCVQNDDRASWPQIRLKYL